MRTCTLLFLVFLMLLATPARTQFVKQVDEHGHVTYSDDPGYDYAGDEPPEPERRAARRRQQELERWLDSRRGPRASAPGSPSVSVRRRTHCQRVTRTLCDRR